MPAYDIFGNEVFEMRDMQGNIVTQAYDIFGNLIVSGEVDYSNYSYIQKWGSKGMLYTQGFAIRDDKVYWVSQRADTEDPIICYVYNLSNGSQALSEPYIYINGGHGNNLEFDGNKLYVSAAYTYPRVYINNMNGDVATLDKILICDDGSIDNDACLDETDKDIMWTIGHSARVSVAGAPFNISKWDLSDLIDNGDGTYSPALLQTVQTRQLTSPYFQGIKMHDGLLWYSNGYNGDDSDSYVYAIDPNTGDVKYTIDLHTTTEPEGIEWYPDSSAIGGYALYVGFLRGIMRKYTFGYKKHSGKKLSILGDSISTYAGYIPQGNSNFYTGSNCGVTSVDQTWWKRLIDASGMTLLVNNSWSGAKVSGTDESSGITRASDLGEDPDVIIVYMGINDFNNEVAVQTFTSAYEEVVSTIKETYPRVELYCATLVVCERNGDAGDPEINDAGVYLSEYNAIIVDIAFENGVKVLDFSSCGITYSNLSEYMGDWTAATGKALHPNSAGHSMIAMKALTDMNN